VKVDTFAAKVPNFNVLLLQARKFAAKVPNFNVLLLQARKIMIDKIDAADVEADGAEAKHSSSSSGDAESSRTAGKFGGYM